MANQVDKTRKYFIRSYLTEEQLKNILEKNRSIIYRWAYAYHDKDKDENGKDKVTHCHIFIEFTNTYKISKPRNMFKGLIDDKGKEINTHIEYAKKTTAHAVQYLVHKGFDDKYQYSADIIKFDNIDIEYCLSLDLTTKSSTDNSFDILNSLVEKGFHHENLMELAKTYGKDFIFHWKSYSDLAQCILHGKRMEEKRKETCVVDKQGVVHFLEPCNDDDIDSFDDVLSGSQIRIN